MRCAEAVVVLPPSTWSDSKSHEIGVSKPSLSAQVQAQLFAQERYYDTSCWYCHTFILMLKGRWWGSPCICTVEMKILDGRAWLWFPCMNALEGFALWTSWNQMLLKHAAITCDEIPGILFKLTGFQISLCEAEMSESRREACKAGFSCKTVGCWMAQSGSESWIVLSNSKLSSISLHFISFHVIRFLVVCNYVWLICILSSYLRYHYILYIFYAFLSLCQFFNFHTFES